MKNIGRWFASVWADIREYWLVRAARFASETAFWALVFATVTILLPFSPERRKRIAACIGNRVGRLLWAFRDFSVLREWLPPMRNLVRTELRDFKGHLKWADYGFNVRTNGGRDWQCDRMGKVSSPPAGANYISVHSASAYTPAAEDTIATWETNEELANGFGREVGTYAHTPGEADYTLEHTYTATGTVIIYGAALINEGDSPTEALFCAKNFGTEASMIDQDTLKVTWSITV